MIAIGPVVLVGGAGELGRCMVRRLERQGVRDVRVVDLRPYPGPEPVRSYVLDASAPDSQAQLAEAFRGARSVVSMIMPSLLTAREQDYVRCNVYAVRAAIDAAWTAGARNFLYVSSVAVMDHFTEHVGADEGTPLPPIERYRSPYDRTKRQGEDEVLAVHDPAGMRTCSVRLGGLLCTPRSLALRVPFGPVSVVMPHHRPVDMNSGVNAAWGLWLALVGLDQGRAGGEAFFITGTPLNAMDLARQVNRRRGRPALRVPEPVYRALLWGLRLGRAAGEALGWRGPALPLHAAISMGEYAQTFDNEKARRVLGYRPLLSTEQTFDRLVAMWRGADAPAIPLHPHPGASR